MEMKTNCFRCERTGPGELRFAQGQLWGTGNWIGRTDLHQKSEFALVFGVYSFNFVFSWGIWKKFRMETKYSWFHEKNYTAYIVFTRNLGKYNKTDLFRVIDVKTSLLGMEWYKIFKLSLYGFEKHNILMRYKYWNAREFVNNLDARCIPYTLTFRIVINS